MTYSAKIFLFGISLCLTAMFFINKAVAKENKYSGIEVNQFLLNTDVSIIGTHMTLEENDQYKLATQWPITHQAQWAKLLNDIGNLKETPELYNPIVEKNSSVIIFVQNNPDQISGEDIYMSDKNTILRIKRMPKDTVYVGAGGFYNLLHQEMKKYKTEFSATSSTQIPLTSKGIIVIFRENSTLTNTGWKVTDPTTIEAYNDYIANFVTLRNRREQDMYYSKYNFDDLDTFLVYLNIPGSTGNLIVVRHDGLARLTNIELQAKGYIDTKNYYNIFLEQAKESKKMVEESDQKRYMNDTRRNF